MKKLKKHLTLKGIAAVTILSLLLFGAAALVLAGEKTERGYLGVSVKSLTDDNKEEFGVKFGVLVTTVMKGEAAEKAGIKKYDVIQYFNDEKIRRPNDLIDEVRETKPGTKAKVKIVRDGEHKVVPVTLGTLKSAYSWFDPGDGKNFYFYSGKGRGYLGVHLQELNEDLAGYFGVKADEGVLILKVEDDSPAEKAGLKSGDVIVELDGKKISDSGKVNKVVSAYEKGDEIEIKILRHKNPKTIKVELGERPGFRSFDILKSPGYIKSLKNTYMPYLEFAPGSEGDYRIILRNKKAGDEIKKKIKEEIKKKVSKETKIEHI